MIATTPPYGPDDVSLLGTGAMGRPMAAHLVRASGKCGCGTAPGHEHASWPTSEHAWSTARRRPPPLLC